MSAYTTEILDMKLGGMVCPSCEDVIAAAAARGARGRGRGGQLL